jgi:hypothetical protein
MEFDRNTFEVEILAFQQIAHVFEKVHNVVKFCWRVIQIQGYKLA